MTRHLRPGLVVALLLSAGCDFLPFPDFEPTGPAFSLNAGIETVSITGDPGLSDNGPFALAFSARCGSDTLTDTLPAGLLFRSRSSVTQHMVLLKAHPVIASPGAAFNRLGSFCCNRRRVSPDLGDTFDLGPTTDDAGLAQVVALVRGKDISGGADMWMVQRAVYQAIDSAGLSQAYVDSINGLPDDTGRTARPLPQYAVRRARERRDSR
jgi:hypothetical protein